MTEAFGRLAVVKQFTRGHLILIALALLLFAVFLFVRDPQYFVDAELPIERSQTQTAYWTSLFNSYSPGSSPSGTVAGQQTLLLRGPAVTPRGAP